MYLGPPVILFLQNSNTAKEPMKRFQFGDEVMYFDLSKLGTQYHFNKPDVLGSCNGLVCLYSPFISVDKIYICNPFTREYVNLPNLKLPPRIIIYGEENNFYFASGFGCHPVTNEYKVVRIYLHDKEEQLRQVQVYTLGSGKWRSILKTPLSLRSINSKGVLLNGAIHWMNGKLEIISFDLADEEFITVSRPPLRRYFRGDDKKIHQLGIFGESLCVIEQNFSVERSDIWVMNKNEDDDCIWTKKLSIPWTGTFSVYKLLSLSRHGGKLLMRNAWVPALISYDVKTKGLTETQRFPTSEWFDIIPYKKSFVSLKALGEPAKRMSE